MPDRVDDIGMRERLDRALLQRPPARWYRSGLQLMQARLHGLIGLLEADPRDPVNASLALKLSHMLAEVDLHLIAGLSTGRKQGEPSRQLVAGWCALPTGTGPGGWGSSDDWRTELVLMDGEGITLARVEGVAAELAVKTDHPDDPRPRTMVTILPSELTGPKPVVIGPLRDDRQTVQAIASRRVRACFEPLARPYGLELSIIGLITPTTPNQGPGHDAR